MAIFLLFLGAYSLAFSFSKSHAGSGSQQQAANSKKSVATISEVKFDSAEISVGGRRLQVELAQTDEQMRRGLMYRRTLGENAGMLFVYKQAQPLGFWMKNTFLPLSIGFFDQNKVLLEVVDMKPVVSEMQVDIPTYQSTRPAQYALEVNQGWFKKNNIQVGARLLFTKGLSH